MDLRALMEEAEALVRAGLFLVPDGTGSPAAWKFPRSAGRPAMAVAMDERTLIVVPDGRGGGRVEELDAPPRGGSPLFARPWKSYPPIEGIFLLGSARVGDWLEANQWERSWGYNDNFGGRDLVHEYESWWQSQHPFYTKRAAAVRGGWHFVWPDDDWLDRVHDELVLWTLTGEPWIEVWAESTGMRVIERVT